jgi:predicted DsbA family dithiol-disulfide isomerase
MGSISSGLVPIGLPDRTPHGRADRLAQSFAPAENHLGFEGYQYAREHGKGNDYNHCVLEAFFVEGRDIGDIGVLTKLAGEVGLDVQEFGQALRTRRYREAHIGRSGTLANK